MIKGKSIKKIKGEKKMAYVIDIHDLTEEEAKLVREFVEFLRGKAKRGKKFTQKEEIAFGAWPLGVKGKLTRREIYDYL
jgi:hypothetical protein